MSCLECGEKRQEQNTIADCKYVDELTNKKEKATNHCPERIHVVQLGISYTLLQPAAIFECAIL